MSFWNALRAMFRYSEPRRNPPRPGPACGRWARCLALDLLENRLPLGDWLLASLLGPAWLGARLADPVSAPWGAEPAGARGLKAARALPRPSPPPPATA